MLRAITGAAPRRGNAKEEDLIIPKWGQSGVVNSLHSISRWACTHPVYTIAFVALMASTSYISMLESSLFDAKVSRDIVTGQVNLAGLTDGSKTLHSSAETGWKWQNCEVEKATESVRLSP